MSGRVALVTGGGYGMGRASALRFAAAGAAVVVLDIDAVQGKETVRLIGERGGEASFVEGDVAIDEHVAAAVETAERTYGRLDHAHNNAGILGRQDALPELPLDEWARVIGTNLTGTFLCLRHEIPAMLRTGGGSIVNVASETAFKGNVADAAYTASKHGVRGLTTVAGLAYAKQNVRVNAVAPGNVDTGIIERARAYDPESVAWAEQVQPIGRLGTAEEIAEIVVWLCSDAATLINATVVAADTGWHVA
jgi:NAD(P)-dependent dehydrogenase (short-subunit alcohol dehydrogenase family)